MTTAFVSGITGQDGAYLAELLLGKSYRVFGGYRRSSSGTFWRLAELGLLDHPNLTLVETDVTDLGSIIRVLTKYKPREVYNLAAQSFVAVSFQEPTTTAQITGLGALQMLEAIRIVDPAIRYYQASSAEMFGLVGAVPQNEATPFHPRSAYGVSKVFAHGMAINYRESYGLFASCGILFNHESPLRGLEFVTRKITRSAAQVRLGGTEVLRLGNLDSRRDWGYAREYVEGMWRILQAREPSEFVLATGTMATVRDFATAAYRAAGRELVWSGTGVDEIGRCAMTGETLVMVDPAFFRPADVVSLVGDAGKAKRVLGWEAITPLETLCQIMVEADVKRVSEGRS